MYLCAAGLAAFVVLVANLVGCGSKSQATSIEQVTDIQAQDSIFQNLVKLTHGTIPDNTLNDSLAFLILPVQASCPSCRKKTIDSIVKHQQNLDDGRFIVISANGGRKTIGSFFKEQDERLPVIENRLFLDTINQAYKYDLYKDKPTIYYTYQQKAYKKVAAIPATVREDLREFFSGYRSDEHKNH